jgi:hypothetical protein
MRCYFMKRGHIVGVELLDGLSDEQACEKALALFEARTDGVEGFEVWDRARMVIQHPPVDEEPSALPLIQSN